MAHVAGGAAARIGVVSATLPARLTDTAGVVDAVRDAIESRTPVRIAGAGSWLDAGRPVRADRVLSLADVAGIVEYVPGDLTLTARAGTSLDEIAAVTGEHGQYLPLDPAGSRRGTIGATVATGSAGPLAHAFGPPRELVLGVECVTGRGDVVRGGGRVTKNVAGFDLTRLFTGSWGTLGVITEVTVRLRGRPLVDATIAIPMPRAGKSLAERLRAIRAARIEPYALELVGGSLAGALGLEPRSTLLVRLAGNPDAVRGQRTVLDMIDGASEIHARVWDDLAAIEPPRSWSWRLSDLPSLLAERWIKAESAVGTAGWVHASVGRGIVRCIVPADRPAMDVERIIASSRADGGTLIIERSPTAFASPGASDVARDRVSRRIREAFDPDLLLNPGILGEETP
jgi:glycolate oxidase FAD binding subunit